MNATAPIEQVSLENIAQFLYREARFLDDEQWDQWLACYAPTASFWMPAWDDDDRLTEDPQSEISLIYYPDRQGLEDRVFRIKTERSSATMPVLDIIRNCRSATSFRSRFGCWLSSK